MSKLHYHTVNNLLINVLNQLMAADTFDSFSQQIMN